MNKVLVSLVFRIKATRNLRILFVHSGSDLYGASRSLLRLSSRLVRDGHTVNVVLPSQGPLVAELKKKGIDILVQSSLPILDRQKVQGVFGVLALLVKVIFSTIRLALLMKQFNPDLTHTMTAVILSSGPAAKLTGVPHIWHVRESFSEFGKLWSYYQNYMLRFSTRIVCVSTPIAQQFRGYEENSKIIVIHNGFPAEEFSDITEERVKQFRSKYVDSEEDCLVGVVGRIKFRRKGQEVFVRAAGLVREKFPNARFLCIGSPFPGNESHLDNLHSLIQELNLQDTVLYTGDVEDIKAAIAALDILVLPSAQPEPFGGVVVEAMALSRPVIATNIGGSVEQVVNGVTGLLVEPGDAQDLARGLEKLLESEDCRRRFGENGRARFLEKFEFEAFYRRILSLYEDMVA